MAKWRSSLAAGAALLLAISSPVGAALFLTADADLRYRAFAPDAGSGVGAVGAGVRQVFADAEGDRVTVFALLESLDDFDRTMFDQAYVRYKGPLGMWNVTAGRYLVPYGLLTSYSAKRLLVETVEPHTTGVEADSGIMLSGFVGDFDYAVSFSEGVGMRKWWDADAKGLLTARIGREGQDFEAPKPGLSVAWGKSAIDMHGHTMGDPVWRIMGGADVTWNRGPGTLRAEASGGRQDGAEAYALFAGMDYSLLRPLELNVAWAHHFTGHGDGGGLYAGLTADVLGLKARTAYRLGLEKEDEDELVFQLYWYFRHTR